MFWRTAGITDRFRLFLSSLKVRGAMGWRSRGWADFRPSHWPHRPVYWWSPAKPTSSYTLLAYLPLCLYYWRPAPANQNYWANTINPNHFSHCQPRKPQTIQYHIYRQRSHYIFTPKLSTIGLWYWWLCLFVRLFCARISFGVLVCGGRLFWGSFWAAICLFFICFSFIRRQAQIYCLSFISMVAFTWAWLLLGWVWFLYYLLA